VSSIKWRRRIEDILDAIAEIQAFSAGTTLEQFRTDAKTLKAVSPDLIIIGEAANHIPDDVQYANQDVPWVLIRAMRNRVVHVYFDIDPDILLSGPDRDWSISAASNGPVWRLRDGATERRTTEWWLPVGGRGRTAL
jgi:uncharacterized protein with HEPN domain